MLSLFFLLFMYKVLKTPIHPVSHVHQDTKIKPDDQRESIDKRKAQYPRFNPVDKKDAGKFDGGKSKNNQQP